MNLLDLATAQGCFRSKLNVLRAVVVGHDKLLGRELCPNVSVCYTSFRIPNKFLNVDRLGIKRRHSSIKAVAIVENQTITGNRNGKKPYKSKSDVQLDSVLEKNQFSSEDSGEMEEKERLRRLRISEANKGKSPWNKGRKHSPETRKLIRERVKQAMQDPKIRMKLSILGSAQSKETRQKIGETQRIWWEKRRKQQMLQEACYFEWQNLIAEASRKGFLCEKELEWDSYERLEEQIQNEWLESIIERRKMPRPKIKRGPKTMEQKRKISEAIQAKWTDEDYRDKVSASMVKYHASVEKDDKKLEKGDQKLEKDDKNLEKGDKKLPKSPKKKIQSIQKRVIPDDSTDLSLEEALNKTATKPKRSHGPRYKDPSASSKLEMIKNIRAQRSAAETQQIEAVERARIMIAEARKAADALEVAARTSPIARASLIETRKLIAEAIQSIESSGVDLSISDESTANSTYAPTGGLEHRLHQEHHLDQEATTGSEVSNGIVGNKVNGNDLLSSEDLEDLDLTKLALESLLNDDNDNIDNGGFLPSSPSLYGLPWFDSPGSVKQIDEINQLGLQDYATASRKSTVADFQPQKEEESSHPTQVTKKWIRGRLVEVAEGE